MNQGQWTTGAGMVPCTFLSMSLTVIALQPRRNIALTAEHAPDFDMGVALNVEDQVRIPIKRP
jgi:hypothetical protein